MIKYILLSLLFIVLFIVIFHNCRVYLKNKKEMSTYTNKIELKKEFNNAIVVYYSYSKNARTKDIAKRIQKQINADIYEIKTENPMPSGTKIYISSKKELTSKNYPKIINDIPNIENYDIIFVGAPVWWYTMATPLYSFLQIVDFHNKKVIPFSTQGSNYGTFFEDFKNKAKNAIILKGENFNNLSEEYDDMVDNKITNWLNNLNF